MNSAAYRIYMAALVFVMTVIPLSWGAVESLADPGMVAVLTSSKACAAAVALGIAVVSFIIYLGTQRGPVVGRPFVVSVLVASPRSRARTMRRYFWRNAGILSAITAYVVSLFLVALRIAGALTDLQLVGSALGVLAFCAVLAWGWLFGQVLASPGSRAALTDGICGISGLLQALFGPAVVAQSQRWQAAWNAFYVGDSTDAFALYQPTPHRGRYRKAVSGGSAVWRTFRADIVSATRMPSQLIASIIGTILGIALLLQAVELTSRWGGALGAVGALVLYFALGPLTARFKYVVDLHRNPALFRYSTRHLGLLHSVFPLVIVTVCAGLTLTVWHAAFSTLGTASLTLFIGLILLIALRWYNSAKRDLPVVLLTPMDSPVGDFSGLNVLLWQAQAPLAAALLGAFIALLGG